MECICRKVSVYEQETQIMATAFIRGKRLLLWLLHALQPLIKGGYYWHLPNKYSMQLYMVTIMVVLWVTIIVRIATYLIVLVTNEVYVLKQPKKCKSISLNIKCPISHILWLKSVHWLWKENSNIISHILLNNCNSSCISLQLPYTQTNINIELPHVL